MDQQSNKSSTKIPKLLSTERAYQALAIDDEGRLCKDIPEEACNQQPRHFFTHVRSLTFSKLADSFVDPKLILSWLLTQLNASSTTIGFLVPIREAGALLPQLFFSEWVRTRQQRKWVWASGAAIQGLAAIAMVLSVCLLSEQLAGIGILVCLTILAIARSFCSVSYKDVLGKTLSKATRGTATGTANSIAAGGIILFALLLSFNLVQLNTNSILILLGIAGVLWFIAAINFIGLDEKKGSVEGGENGANNLIDRIKSAFSDNQFGLFVISRGLLTATALAPPFMILLVQQQSNLAPSSGSKLLQTTPEIVSYSVQAGQLGFLLLASSLASLTSSFFWGRLADRSSRKVIIFAAVLATGTLATISFVALFYPTVLSRWYCLPTLLFLLMVAYQGVRLGRSIHLVDMATTNTRANFTAVSNSAIGILLLMGSLFGWLAQVMGVTWVLLIFSMMCFVASLVASRLTEVQN